ncbi:heterokaryon incompatibility protein-domain-containing protein [Xylaria flabelliformis]|nr:heterokaryon incompatibility protein-domain-containing protein [Xylaria flabelliformis]
MRLINTDTLDLEEFYGTEIPKYAILSHTWLRREEVTFQEWLKRNTDTSVRAKSGYAKILAACRLARKSSLEWLWVDTNCIDKTSSAELAEAINSMYAWYRESAVCYAYLSDVSTSPGPENDLEFNKEFSRSRWWTRGWTLQELLAPRKVLFFTREWKLIDNRTSLATEIGRIAGISQEYLLRGGTLPQRAYASEKMSWLSWRETTRIEDMAYCMLGLFDINMPLLYGEGRKAFLRLQEEIIRVSNDHTIFCWTWTKTVPKTWVSMLAPWPDTFVNSSGFEAASTSDRYESVPTPYSTTNVGLSIKLPAISTISSWFVFLDVRHRDYPERTCSCIHISRLGESGLLRRCQFPKSPIALRRSAAEKKDGSDAIHLHDWIIASRMPLVHFVDYPNIVPQNYNILLFIDKAIINLRTNSDTFSQRPIARADTSWGTFDPATKIYTLAPVGSNAYAGLCYLQLRGNRELSTYLFFAVVNASTTYSSWHCDVALYEDIEYLHIPLPEHERRPRLKMMACGETWFQQALNRALQQPDGGSMVSETKDRSLKLGIGGPVNVEPGFDLRSAYLSIPGKFDLPVRV